MGVGEMGGGEEGTAGGGRGFSGVPSKYNIISMTLWLYCYMQVNLSKMSKLNT